MKTQHTPARNGSKLNWLVVNQDGKLLAVLDSESEAYFFTRNRGHACEAVYFSTPCDYSAAPELLEALQATLAHAEQMTCELEKTDDLSEFPYIQTARAILARITGGQNE